MKTQHRTVLNSQATKQQTMLIDEPTNEPTIKALCQTLPSVIEGDDNKWLPLIPLGEFSGRDGRSWVNDNPEQVVNSTQLPFILDIDHASETTDDTEASGWITELKIEDDHIMGLFEFNSLGKQKIADKRYKFYSPAFIVDKQGVVQSLCSVGLTNKPNLNVPALNAEQPNQLNQPTQKPSTNHKDSPMLEELLKALGLSADTDQATALNAIQALQTTKQTNAQQANQPDLNSFVPKATHEQTVTELNTANAKLAELETAKHNEAVEVAINKAIADKKIAPADKDYYTAQCATEQGLADFSKFANSKAPVIGDSNLTDKPPAGTGDTNKELNAEQQAVLAQMGVVLD